MKRKLTANALYMGAIALAISSAGCGSAIENSENGWVALVWAGVAVVLCGLSVVVAALGVLAERPKPKKSIHGKPEKTITAGKNRRKGA